MVGLVSRGPVSCQSQGHDRYGRVLAVCSAGGVDLGAAMVRNGYAVDYARYSTRYSAQARAARQERRGLWNGPFERPEAYRHSRD
jgi:endonuclease YncB( thermonuclease family)